MIDLDTLFDVIDRHELWIKGRPGGERAVFIGMDLSHAVFRGHNLSQAVFCDSDLRSAKLLDCCCIYAYFRNARLSGADIVNCNFACADLTSATFGGGALIAASDFELAIARNANFLNTCIYRSDFHGTDLTGAKYDSKLIFQHPAAQKGGIA